MSLHKNIRLLGWFNFLSDFRLYAPVAILYFTQVSGSFALGMSVFSVIMLASSLFEVPTGVISDRVGRRRTAVFGALASTASVICYALGGSVGMLLVGAALEGLSRAFFSGNNDALLHDTLSQSGQQDTYDTYLGQTAAMYQIALALAAVLGSILAAYSFPLVMWLSVLPQALAVLVSLQFEEPQRHADGETNLYAHLRAAFSAITRNPRLRQLSLGKILGYALGEATFEFRAAFLATLWPVWAIGITRLIANVMAAISFYFAGRLIRRFGEAWLILGGYLISHAYTLVIALMGGILAPALLSLPSIFFGVNTVASSSLMQREFTVQQRATMGSLTAFGGSLTFAVFALILGVIADRIGPLGAFLVGTGLSFIPPLFYAAAFRQPTAQHAAEGVGAANR